MIVMFIIRTDKSAISPKRWIKKGFHVIAESWMPRTMEWGVTNCKLEKDGGR